MINPLLDQFLSGNQVYLDYLERWKYLYNSYVGGEIYQEAGYLTRYQLESDNEYISRLRATPLDNHCRGVINIYNSFLFREKPNREFKELENISELNDFLKDADYEGRSFDNFMKEVSAWSAVFGHCWIIMSKPNIGARSRADEMENGIRPYVSLLTPLVVLDWSWERSPSGKYQLSYLRYVEEINGSVQTIKEWIQTEIKTTTVDSDNNTIDTETIEVNELGLIPAVIAYNSRSIIRGVGISAIDDIADAQKFIYNATSEVDQSIRLDSHPSLVVTPETIVGTGSGAIIKVPDNLDPGLKPYVLDFSGASIQSIYTAIDNTVKSIEKMANIGSIRATESRVMSGVAMETEFQLLNARLSEMADNLELAEEQLWRLFCMYQNLPYAIHISYPGSFNIKNADNEINQLATAAATNPVDARVKAGIDMRILDWLDLDEDEVTAMMNNTLIDLDNVPEDEGVYKPKLFINPVTGESILSTNEQQQLELVRVGWVENE